MAASPTSPQQPHAFVTGATGFIGTNLVQLLYKKGWTVTALCRSSSDRSALAHLPIQWYQGCITDLSFIKQAIAAKTDVVFHLAGDTSLWGQQNNHQTAVNVTGTSKVVTAAAEAQVGTFIHASSVAAWGQISGTVHEETHQHGSASWINYERTKYAGEREALKGTGHGMRVVILNPTNVLGPHDITNWGRLFLALSNGQLPFLANGTVHVAHVEAVADAFLQAYQHGASGERYILGGARGSIRDLAEHISRMAGIKNVPPTIPRWLFRGAGIASSAWSRCTRKPPTLSAELAYLMTRTNVHYRSDKAQNHLHYCIPPMKDTLSDAYQWLSNQNHI